MPRIKSKRLHADLEPAPRFRSDEALLVAYALVYVWAQGVQPKPQARQPVPLGLAGWLALLKHGVVVSFRVAPAALLLGPGQLAGALPLALFTAMRTQARCVHRTQAHAASVVFPSSSSLNGHPDRPGKRATGGGGRPD